MHGEGFHDRAQRDIRRQTDLRRVRVEEDRERAHRVRRAARDDEANRVRGQPERGEIDPGTHYRLDGEISRSPVAGARAVVATSGERREEHCHEQRPPREGPTHVSEN